MERHEYLDSIEGSISLKDLLHLVRAEGWKFDEVHIEGWEEDAGGRLGLEVYRKWDDGVLPPVPAPFVPAAPTDAQFNQDLLDLPDIGDLSADPVHATYGPTAPYRVHVDGPPKGKPTIKQTLSRWAMKFQMARESDNDHHPADKD